MQEEIKNHLFSLIYSNLYSSEPRILETALKNRFIGFRSEIEFVKLCLSTNKVFFNGGYILPLRTQQKTLSAPIYFSIDSRHPKEYKDLYTTLNRGRFSKLLYIQFENTPIESWDTSEPPNLNSPLPIPKFKVFDFQGWDFIECEKSDIQLFGLLKYFTKKKTSFNQSVKLNPETVTFIKGFLEGYSNEDLINTYVNRLVFDGFIGMNYYKGIPSDIDLIIQKNRNEFTLYEIKEKDLSKTNPIGFGIDVQRLRDCLSIAQTIGTRYIYIVRQVNNQNERKFVEWRFIDFVDFEKQMNTNLIKEGGTGMNTLGTGNNPTILVEEKHFLKI